MKLQINNRSGMMRFVRGTHSICFLGIYLLTMLFFQACEPPRPTAYPILAPENTINYNTYEYSNGFKLLGKEQTKIIVSPGDLLLVEETAFPYYPGDVGLHIGIGNDTVGLTLVTDSVILDSEENSPFQIAELLIKKRWPVQSLMFFTDSLTEDQMQFVNLIAQLYPTAGLSFDSESDYVKDVLLKFEPRWVVLGNVETSVFALLQDLTATETLFFSVPDSVVVSPLPRINSLKSIYINSESCDLLPSDFFSNNTGIEKLWMMAAGEEDFSCLSDLINLSKLTISADGLDLNDLSFLQHLKGLKELQISADSIGDISGLFALKKLQKLAIGMPMSQAEFDRLIQQNEGIRLLAFYNHSDQQSLVELKNLKNLEALFFADTIYDRNTIPELSQLKLLGIPESLEEDSAYLKLLQKQLPNCQIGINYGFCMGTGWLLAFFPLLVIFVLLGRLNKKQRSR